eukprot:TRINITY_DN27714_c0_g1_i2.p1 TRINITY_DN27714_c0_g1~~TRINITY_DN27714_c0_g1_i2.p1  ORF type:complete len:427 (+),score=105.63 TRINITY_DN27714_c0_g1_i2:82-1362(+)
MEHHTSTSLDDLSEVCMGTLSGGVRSQDCSPAPTITATLEDPAPRLSSAEDDGTELLMPSHHAVYQPLVTNPMECLAAHDGGNAAELPRVNPDRTSSLTRKFYVDQNNAIDSFLEVDDLRRRVTQGEYEEEEIDSFPVTVGVRLSFFVNLLILATKVVLVLRTGSVSFVASLLDSVLDLMSGLTLVISNRFLSKQNRHKYPLGKQTFEPLGTLVFSACMFTASFQLIQYSVQVLVSQNHEVEFDLFSGIFIGSIIIVKFGLFIYCYSNRKLGSALEALAQDHRNDVMSNTLGTAAALAAKELYGWIDPVVAILLTLYIMYSWARTGIEQIMMLSGKSAPPDVLKKLTYAARHHHPAILFVDTVRAVAMGGSGYQVEVDVVLPPTMKLREAHDIGESLQIVLEKSPEVSRAYVHLDYEFAHSPWDHR